MAAAEGGSEDESHGDVDGFGASAVDGTMCGARLRRRGREGEPPVLEVGAEKMTRWGWVGGKVYVEEHHVRWGGSEVLLNTQSVMPVQGVMQYKGRIPVSGIESVELRRGVVGVPYVSVTLTDGAEVQLRAGVAGSKCALLVQEIEAAIARSDAG